MLVVRHAASAPSGSDTHENLWSQTLMGKHPDEGLEALQQSGVLQATFPEVHAMVGFGGGTEGHKDLWAHTKQVVAQTKAVAVLRWAALFHDVGKVVTFSREHGKVTFHHHEAQSARMTRRALNRVGFLTPEDRELVVTLVHDLGLVEAYTPGWTDSAVRRLHKSVEGHFQYLLALSRADITTKHKAKRERYHQQVHDLEQRALAIKEHDAKVPPLPTGLGNVLSQVFGIPPSKKLGELMGALKAAVEEGKVEAHREPDYYVAVVTATRSEYGV